MTALLAPAIVAAALASDPGAAALADWRAIWPGVQTLDVGCETTTEFIADGKWDLAAGRTVEMTRVTTTGRFRFVRTPDGPAADLTTYDAKNRPAWAGLLLGDSVYSLDFPAKKAARHKVTGGDAAGFLARNFDPLALFTDPARAGAYHVRTANVDAHYTYLHVLPTAATAKAGVHFDGATVAVLRHPAAGWPAGVPVLIRQRGAASGQTTTVRVTMWLANAPGGPTEASFTPPDPRDGWKVTDYEKLWPEPRKQPPVVDDRRSPERQ